jgi:hypothetical protein
VIRTMEDVKALARMERGFLSPECVKIIATLEPQCKLLIRFGAGRDLVPACKVDETIAAWEKEGDYVRDVCFPFGDPAVDSLFFRRR